MTATDNLIPHLFRHEFSRIVSVLCARYGIAILDDAEDIVSETFLAALETWPYRGRPESPTAWLYFVAGNKARNRLKHERIFSQKIIPALKAGDTPAVETEIDLSGQNIDDSQLQMFFAVCSPVIPEESQIALALRILCGFGIDELATAFLISPAAASKRLVRAKEDLRRATVSLQMPQGEELPERLGAVLKAIYLLFNEGYYSESQNTVVREELCVEAMRLNHLLLNNPNTDTPEVRALMALMCFHASRLPARTDGSGRLVLYADQDESLWNQELIARGSYYFKMASGGARLSRYHLEAGIAWWHTIKSDTNEKWENILQLYNRLLQLEYSPVAALNRTFALSKVQGYKVALKEAEKLSLTKNPYYHLLLGELYSKSDPEKAKIEFVNARGLVKSASEKAIIDQKIAKL